MSINISSNPFPVTYESLGDNMYKWQLLQTNDLTAQGSPFTTANLTAKKSYLIVFDSVSTSASGTITMRVNGKSTNIYYGKYMDNITLVTYNNQAQFTMLYSNAGTQNLANIFISGKALAAGGNITWHMEAGGNNSGAGKNQGLFGLCTLAASEQISNFTFLYTGTITGTIKIYGSD